MWQQLLTFILKFKKPKFNNANQILSFLNFYFKAGNIKEDL